MVQAMFNPFPGPVEMQTPENTARLTNQLDAIKQIFFRGMLRDVPVARWLTLQQISDECKERHRINAPLASVSAQLRHLRKSEHGGYTVTKRHVGDGLYEYNVEEHTPVPELPTRKEADNANAAG